MPTLSSSNHYGATVTGCPASLQPITKGHQHWHALLTLNQSPMGLNTTLPYSLSSNRHRASRQVSSSDQPMAVEESSSKIAASNHGAVKACKETVQRHLHIVLSTTRLMIKMNPPPPLAYTLQKVPDLESRQHRSSK